MNQTVRGRNALTPEPRVERGGQPEAVLRSAVRAEISALLTKRTVEGLVRDSAIIGGFGLDLAIFLELAKRGQRVRFFELKAFLAHRPVGVGFGNRMGEGTQVDLLMLSQPLTALLDAYVRWILVDGTRPLGTPRFAIFTCVEAKIATMNGVARGKQNNLRVNQLIEDPLTWDQLSEWIEDFILA